MKKIIGLIVVLSMLFASTAMAAANSWKVMEGGMSGEGRAPFTAEDTASGIQIKGSGGYDMAGSAAGVILTQPISNKSLTVELQVNQIAGLRSKGADHWIAVNLLNQPQFFSLDHPGNAEGLNVFIRPYADGLLDVWVYGITGADGWVGIGGTDADNPADKVKWNNKSIKLEFVSADTNVLKVNGTEIYGDLSMITNKLFKDGKAYFSTGASNAGAEEFAYTIKSVNGSAVSLAGGSIAAEAKNGTNSGDTSANKPGSAGSTPAPVSNPQTGDSGVGMYAVLAVIAIGALLLLGRKSVRQG